MIAAEWTVTGATSSVDADGTARAEVSLADAGVAAGVLVLTMTAGRELRAEWHAVAGAQPLTDFQAWARVAQ